MGIYTVEKQKFKKNENSSMGVRNSIERPKIRRFRRKGYRKNLQRLKHVMLHTGRI